MGCNHSTLVSPDAKTSATVAPSSGKDNQPRKNSTESIPPLPLSMTRTASTKGLLPPPSVSTFPESAPVKQLLVTAWNEDAGNALRLLLKKSGKIRKHFETFLKDQYTEEHVEFLVAVEKLSQLHQQAVVHPEQAWEYAKQIFDKHIQPGSIAEVNLSAKARNKEFTINNYQEYLAKAEEEIIQMLALDLFPRFLQSSHCERMLEELAIMATGTHGKELTYNESEGGGSSFYGSDNETRTKKTGPDSSPSESTAVVPLSPELPGFADENKLLRSIQKAKSTARKSAGIWLEAFKAVADLLPTSIVIADMTIQGAPLIYVNKDFMKMTGYGPSEIYGKNCRFLQGPKTDPDTIQSLRDAIKARKEISCEILNYRKNGEEFRNYLTLRPVFWPENYQNSGSLSGSGYGGSTNFSSSLAYFIGVQYEITDDSLMVQRLLHHEAILKMLPTQVTL